MKKDKDLKSAGRENKLDHSFYVKDKHSINEENIFLYCVDFEHIQSNYQAINL
jgi:hypothetical protein